MLSAPVAAQLSRRRSCPIRLVGVGLALWSAGTAACALAPSFAMLLASRAIVGLGCGPFIALAAPVIDDAAPRARRSLWLALLFLCIPSGFALGFVWASLVAGALGWRAAFAVESALMVPLALLALLPTTPGATRCDAGKGERANSLRGLA
jgi:MFS family permease